MGEVVKISWKRIDVVMSDLLYWSIGNHTPPDSLYKLAAAAAIISDQARNDIVKFGE